jgi:S-disulfanyl-L-cysteine oxidoreductase SoxD
MGRWFGVLIAAWAAAVCYSSAHAQQKTAGSEPHQSVWDGVYTDVQAKRGESVYKQECIICHGQTLEGNGEGANPLSGPAFLSMWNGLTLADLFDRMRQTMPQNSPGKLTREQNADVLAYVLSVNRFPSGKTDLARESERLREIKFDPFKQRDP